MGIKHVLNIAYVIEKFPSETEYFILNEISELRKRNICIYILALNNNKSKVYNKQLEELSDFIIYFPGFRGYIQSLYYLINTRKYAFRDNISQACSNIKAAIKKIKYILIASYFENRIKHKNIAHIHAHFAFITADIADILSNILNTRYSFTAHAHDIYCNIESLKTKVHNSNFVITCTRYNESYINNITQNRYCDKLYCIYHGINLSDWQRTKYDVFTNNKIQIVTVARLIEKKGLIYLLSAVKILKEKGYVVKCNIVGDGPLRKTYEQYIENNNISESVHIHGFQSQNTIKEIFGESDIFVLPCIITENGDRDGLPNSLLEAIATGLPVITTRISAIPELVENKMTGILIPEKRADAIVDSILTLYNDRQLYYKISENGRKKVEENFNIEYGIAKLENLFRTQLP